MNICYPWHCNNRMGAFASLLEFDVPQKLAASEHNTIVLSRLLIALLDLGKPELNASRKAGTAALSPFKHPLHFVSRHLRPAHAFAESLARFPELILCRSPESVVSRIVSARGVHAYRAESKAGTKSGVVRVFVACSDLHHLVPRAKHRRHGFDIMIIIAVAISLGALFTSHRHSMCGTWRNRHKLTSCARFWSRIRNFCA